MQKINENYGVLADAGKLPLLVCFRSFVVDLNLCLIGAGFFKLMFRSRMDTLLQPVYVSATHFCTAPAPTQAPFHPHAEPDQGLLEASCAGKPNEFGKVNASAELVQNRSVKTKLLEARGG